MFYKKMAVLAVVVFLIAGCGLRQFVHQTSDEQKAVSSSVPSVQIKDAEHMIIVFITAPENIKALVPAPLVPNPYNIMYITVSRTPRSSGFVYGMELGAAVIYKGKMLNYPVYNVVDNEWLSEQGRRLTGAPIRMGQITLEKKDQKLVASVVREGKTLFKATMMLGEPGDPLEAMPVVNLKTLKGDQKDAPVTVKQLVTMKIDTVKLHELIDGEATLEFDQSLNDGFPKVEVQQVYRSVYRKADYAATDTGVLYDYLNVN